MSKAHYRDNIKCKLEKVTDFFPEGKVEYLTDGRSKNYYSALKKYILNFLGFGFSINQYYIS